MLPVSICIIAKNEEKYIGECLSRLSHFDWEIVVVDTGSTDRTVEIARAYTPNIYHFHWVNDFSAARNYSISKASNDYILAVDCDEYLEIDSQTEKSVLNLAGQIAPHQIGILNRLSPSVEFAPSGKNISSTAGNIDINQDIPSRESLPVIHEHIARFFNRQFTCYQGSIHEQLVSKSGKNLEFVSIPLTFYHIGYSTVDMKKAKASRNISLLETELETGGANPYILFQLGQSYFGLSDYSHALPYFEQALSMEVNEQEEYVQNLVESYGYCLIHLGQHTKALELEGIYPVFSHRADFVFLMGLVYMNNAMFDQAIREFLKATTIAEYAVDGVNSYLAYYNAGVIYECMGNIPEAIKYYSECGNYAPACQRLLVCKNNF